MNLARLPKVIEMLRSSDQVVRKQAALRLKALAENGLTAGECRLAFEAATEDWGHLKKIDMSRVLVVAAVTALESVAASAEMRNWFHFALTSLGRTELFPPRFATHEAFAESNMVSWLAFPTELARTPHEIELMATFPGATSDQRYYLFRFRTHEYDGWMAGLSGPFSVGASPAPAEGKATWSSFTAWDKKTPREHFEKLTEIRRHPE